MSNKINDDQILGVKFKYMKSFPDDRGFFREIIRHNDPFFEGLNFAQWSHSKMQKNVVKAWHFHHVQYDWWYVGLGSVETTLFDNRPESPTYKAKLSFTMGDNLSPDDQSELCVRIPPGVLHGLEVRSEFAHLFYITSEIYNPEEEGRIPFDSDIVPHTFGPNAITVERDRKLFVPIATRALVG